MCGPLRHGLWHTPLFTHLSFHPNIVNLHVGSDLSTAAPVPGSAAILLHCGGGGGDRLPWVPLSLMWAFLFNTVFSRPICVPCRGWAIGLTFFFIYLFFFWIFSHKIYDPMVLPVGGGECGWCGGRGGSSEGTTTTRWCWATTSALLAGVHLGCSMWKHWHQHPLRATQCPVSAVGILFDLLGQATHWWSWW